MWRSSTEVESTMASRLLNEMHQIMRRRHYSIRTEKSYCAWVKRYVHFHEMRSRAGFRNGEQKIEAFLNHLAIDLQVAPSTQNQAIQSMRSSMKLPAVNCMVSSGIGPKPTRLRSMSYGAVASPFIPAAPICRDLRCAPTSCRVFWRRRINNR